MNIALFGTSADPPTTGHKAILRWLVDHFDYVAVWAADNPFKSHQASLFHRSAMLQLVVEELSCQRAAEAPVTPTPQALRSTTPTIAVHNELSNPRTVITVQQARAIWTTAQFTLVVGSDLVRQMPRWYRIKELLEQVELLVVPRPSYPLEEADLQTLRQIGAIITVANLIPPEISSSAYRQWGITEAITAPVDTYIHHHHLYQHAWQDAAAKPFPATMNHHQPH
jgi:nicotinate-nucleotide adenylyltransferase